MYFFVDENWEVRNSPIGAFWAPGTKLYPFVEMPTNTPLWHVDIEADPDNPGDICWRRLLASNVKQVLSLIGKFQGRMSRVAFQPANDPRVSQVLRPVREIVEALDAGGGAIFLVTFSDGGCTQVPDLGYPEEQVTVVRTVYRDAAI